MAGRTRESIPADQGHDKQLKSPLLAYYDPEKESVIQSDASMHGLGCVLLQDGHPICYASRSLADAESRYSNIERELLAACWSLEKFHHYVYGKKVVVETDHKPLESIWKEYSKCISTSATTSATNVQVQC